MTWRRFALAFILIALATAALAAALFPFTACADGFTLRDGFVPYCGAPPAPLV